MHFLEHRARKNAQLISLTYLAGIRRGKKKKSTKRKTTKKRASKRKSSSKKGAGAAAQAKYPRHSVNKVLRIPRAILDQNAGRECSERDAAKFVGVGYAGPFRVEISSAIKYGLLERPKSGWIQITDIARKILRPQASKDELSGLRTAILNAPDVSDVYRYYRGENLPAPIHFKNALVDTFNIPEEKVSEFISIFEDNLKQAELAEEHNGKTRIIDISDGDGEHPQAPERIKKLGTGVKIHPEDACFVMMPFIPPYGDYYSKIYEPAIRKAGLTPMRADDEIFGTGKIMDQIWAGINSAKVLVAELTTRNPNVFYELGLAHALNKPVVLVSRNEDDVPFDLHHIRVIYYDVDDPFWGNKLQEKVAENIISAIKNPDEALFKRALEKRV